jgi:hypothetical protein
MMIRSSSPSVHLLVVLNVNVGDDRTGTFEVRHNIPICFCSGTDSSSRPLLNSGHRKNSHTPWGWLRCKGFPVIWHQTRLLVTSQGYRSNRFLRTDRNRTCTGWLAVQSRETCGGVSMVLISVYAVYTKVKCRVWTDIKQSVYWLGYGLDAWRISVRFSTWTRELDPSLLQKDENGYGRVPNMYSIANNGSFHRDQSGRGYDATHSPPSRSEGKNKWNYPSITAYTHPSLLAGRGMFQDPAREAKNQRIMDELPNESFNIFLVLLLFFRNMVMRSAFCSPSTPWSSRGMAWRPVWLVEQLWCLYSLKGLSVLFLFLGRYRVVRTREKRGLGVQGQLSFSK